MEIENEKENNGLDFTPSGNASEKLSRSSSKRIALFMFMGAGAVFMLVTAAIMGSDQMITGGKPPENVILPSTRASQVIPSLELRQPDPEPKTEEDEDLTSSKAFEEANRNLPSLPAEQTKPRIIFMPAPAQTRSEKRSSVPAYNRGRNGNNYISAGRREAQNQRMQAAMSQTSVQAFGGGADPNANTASNMAGVDAVDASLNSSGSGMDMSMNMGDMSGSSSFSDTTAMSDPNGWSRKEAFANQGSVAGQEYTKHNVMFQRSVFELKAGTVIPCVLISGLNSDLPGNAIAQVSENVWDTATGRYLLIPRGSRLVGNYDNQITYGQNRALVIWNRLIFPDGSSLTLDKLKGADQSGYAGFKGQVNKHWASLITSALLVSLIGAGVELAEPNNNNNNNNNNNRKNVGNILSERVATSIADALTQIVQREVQRQPTIKVKPGYRFMIMAQKDIVFPGSWRR